MEHPNDLYVAIVKALQANNVKRVELEYASYQTYLP